MTAIQPTNAMEALQPSKATTTSTIDHVLNKFDATNLEHSQSTFQTPKSTKHQQTIKEDKKQTVRGCEPAVRVKRERNSIGIDGNTENLNDVDSDNGAVSTESTKKTVSRIDGVHEHSVLNIARCEESGPSDNTRNRMRTESESMDKEKELIDDDVGRMNNETFGSFLKKETVTEDKDRSRRGNGNETASRFGQTDFAEIPKTSTVYVLSIVLRKYTLNSLECRGLLFRDHVADPANYVIYALCSVQIESDRRQESRDLIMNHNQRMEPPRLWQRAAPPAL